jgi:hypothetical protein
MSSQDDKDYEDYLAYQEYLAYQNSQPAAPVEAPPAADQNPAGSPLTAHRTPGAPADAPQPTGMVGVRPLLAGASRVLTAPGQLVTAGAEAVGIAQPGATERYTDATKLVEQQIAGQQMNPDQQGAADAAGLIAGLAVPVGAAGKVASVGKLWKGVKQGAGAGLLGGATNLDPEASGAWDKLISTGLGVTLGAFLSAGMTAVPAARNFLVGLVNKPPTPENVKRLNEVAQSPAFQAELNKLTLAQRNGRFESEIQEARVAGSKAQENVNAQLETARKTLLGRTPEPGQSASQMAVKMQTGLSRTRATAQKAASATYEGTTELAKRVAREDLAYNAGLKVPNTMRAVSESMEGGSAWVDLMDPGVRKYAAQINETAEALVKNNGQIGMDDLISLHQAANRLRAGLAKAERGAKMTDQQASANRIGRRIVDAIDDDIGRMDDAIAQARQASGNTPAAPGQSLPGEKFQQAWGLFKDARKGYQNFIQGQRELDASAVNQLFGFNPKDPEKAWRELLRREPAAQAEAFNILRDQFPETIQDLKRWKLHDAANRLVNQTEQGSRSAVDPDMFVKELTEGNRVIGERLWTPREKDHIKASIAYIRLIQNRSGLQNRGVEPKRVGMAAISRAVPFVVGNLYDIMATGRLEELFFTEAGRKALQTLATAPASTPAYAAAAGYIGTQVGE